MSTHAAARSVRTAIVVDVPIERAFAVFTEDFGAFKPAEHNMLGVEIAETVFEPRVGGYLYDRGVDGSECRWARVLAYEPPHRVLLSWTGSLRPTRRRPASGRSASSPKPRSAPASRSSTVASTATARVGKASAKASPATRAGPCTCSATPSGCRRTCDEADHRYGRGRAPAGGDPRLGHTYAVGSASVEGSACSSVAGVSLATSAVGCAAASLRAAFLACLRSRRSRTAFSRSRLAMVVRFLELDAMRHIPCRGVSSVSALAGSTNRSGVSAPPDVSREPCSPRPRGAAVGASGSPAWAMIQAMIAPASDPSARMAARSMTSPPDLLGRASRVTIARMASSSMLRPSSRR